MENIVSDANKNFSDIETAEVHSKSLNHEVVERIQEQVKTACLFQFDFSCVRIEKNWKLTYPG
jgi:hypothetical protein